MVEIILTVLMGIMSLVTIESITKALIWILKIKKKALTKTRYSRKEVLDLYPRHVKTQQLMQFQQKQNSNEQKQAKQDIHKQTVNSNISTIKQKQYTKQRIKTLSKGLYMDSQDNIDNYEKSHHNKNNQSMNLLEKKLVLKKLKQQNLNADQKQELQGYLKKLIRLQYKNQKKKTMMKKMQQTQQVVYVQKKVSQKYNQQLKQFLKQVRDQMSFKQAIEDYMFMLEQDHQLQDFVFQQFLQTVLNLELIEWTAYFINEMQMKQIAIDKQCIDRYIQMNFKYKIQKKLNKVSRDFQPQNQQKQIEIQQQMVEEQLNGIKQGINYQEIIDEQIRSQDQDDEQQNDEKCDQVQVQDQSKKMRKSAEGYVPGKSEQKKKLKINSQDFIINQSKLKQKYKIQKQQS